MSICEYGEEWIDDNIPKIHDDICKDVSKHDILFVLKMEHYTFWGSLIVVA